MHNQESVLKNETYNVPWDFEIQTDHLISARHVIVNNTREKENLPNSGICCPAKERKKKKRDKYLDLARELKKKTVEHEGDSNTNCNPYTLENP